MTETDDGRHAIELDATSRYFGWVFYRHPDGQWVTLRKATDAEIVAARAAKEGTRADAK